MTKDGGPAFPVAAERFGPDVTDIHILQLNGMSLRDWFAGQALSGLLANASYLMAVKSVTKSGQEANALSCHSYIFADAMLKARDAQD